MNLADITTKCYILALIIRDDGERLLLGDGAYEFKDSQQHFIANTYANDVVELQGTDGQMLAGQVRRTATQTFAGYIGDATFSKQKIEQARRDFLMFFRKKHYYTAVYVFSDGTAIQRDRGYIVNAPSVPELYQRFPEWSVGLNFEDPNYYEYAEDDLGHEIAAHKVELELSTAMSGGLIWDGDGAVSDDLSYVGTEIQGEGKNFQLADTGTATLKSAELLGDATQTTYSGKNLFSGNYAQFDNQGGTGSTYRYFKLPTDGAYTLTLKAKNNATSEGTVSIGFNNTGGALPQQYRWVAQISSASAGQTFSHNNTSQIDGTTKCGYVCLYPATSAAFDWFNNNFEIQLESGSTATTYEPYVGGTASPNPDYPQDVNTVTGEQTVKIEGKNLVNQGHYGTGHTAGGVTANFASEAITMSGTSTSGAWPSFTMYADGSFLQQSWWPTTTAIDTSKGAFNDTGNYRFTIWIDGNRGTAAANFRYIIGYMDGTVTNAYFPLDDASYSFTVTKPINFISVGTANSVTVDCSVRIQLEKGTSGSSFEPYQAQTRPVNLGTNLYNYTDLRATGAFLTVDDNGWYTFTADRSGESSGNYYNFSTYNLALDYSTSYAIVTEIASASITGTVSITTADRWGQFDTALTYSSPAVGTYVGTRTTKSTWGNTEGLASNVFVSAGSKATIKFRISVIKDTSVTASTFTYAPFLVTKNLFNKNSATQNYRLGSTGEPFADNDYYLSDFISVTPDTAYYISGTSGTPASSAICFYDSTQTFISRRGFVNDWYSFTTPENTAFLRFTTQKTNSIDRVQLELGSTATFYEPYGAPYELAKIGTHQDKIYKNDGKWYVEKQVGKSAINITGYNSNYTDVDYAIFDKPTDALNYGTYSEMPALCDSALSPELSGGYNQTAQIGRLCSKANTTHLWIGVAKGTTQATAKTMLDGKSVYYALATPYDAEITSSELVEQLERLRHAHTYADTTNFSITSTSPNLPAFLKVVAFGDDAIPQGGYVWEDGGAGGATTITVDGVDNAQPIWTVVGPATNPSLTNITTGESIQWTGVVPNGQTLVVNMADMTASLSGANVFEFISGSWITLQAGNNRVSYSATAATGIATLEWNGVVG